VVHVVVDVVGKFQGFTGDMFRKVECMVLDVVSQFGSAVS
jgi:hypothetical protein